MEILEVKQSNMILQLLEEKNELNNRINQLELKNKNLENSLETILQKIEEENDKTLTHWTNICWLKNSEGKEKFDNISNFKTEKDNTSGKINGFYKSIEIIKNILKK
jgi:hypothetical protein